MKKFIALLIAVAIVKATIACLNETHTDKYGNTHIRDKPLMFYNGPDKKNAAEYLKKYDLNKIGQYDKDVQSDIAVQLDYLGRYDEALTILKRLQQQYPDDYNIAANLGTTYELTGNNELALQFIKKGMQLNPGSHEGSEWVHIKILEAKMQLAKNPDWLLKNRVLHTGVNFNSKESEALSEKIYDIEYQLEERVPFTPFPDKILGNVFDELGDLLATQESMELAYAMYDFSLKYDPADNYGAAKKMEELKPLLIKNKLVPLGWKSYYYNRELSQIQAEVTEEVITVIANPDSVSKKIGGFKSMVDVFTGEKARREKEKKRRQLFLFAGIGIAAAAVIGFALYKKRKKQL
jgi:tetratricopeptide (TPR) repeat protein